MGRACLANFPRSYPLDLRRDVGKFNTFRDRAFSSCRRAFLEDCLCSISWETIPSVTKQKQTKEPTGTTTTTTRTKQRHNGRCHYERRTDGSQNLRIGDAPTSDRSKESRPPSTELTITAAAAAAAVLGTFDSDNSCSYCDQ